MSGCRERFLGRLGSRCDLAFPTADVRGLNAGSKNGRAPFLSDAADFALPKVLRDTPTLKQL